jgi:hypothetical protein
MLKMSPNHASIFATLRPADLGLSTSGLAEIRWRAMGTGAITNNAPAGLRPMARYFGRWYIRSMPAGIIPQNRIFRRPRWLVRAREGPMALGRTVKCP